MNKNLELAQVDKSGWVEGIGSVPCKPERVSSKLRQQLKQSFPVGLLNTYTG